MVGNFEPLSRRRRILLGTLGTVLCIAVMQIVIGGSVIDKPGLPVPSKIAAGVQSLMSDAAFWSEVGFTLREWMLGLLIASIGGIVVGGLMGAFSNVFIALEIPVEVLRVLPSVAVGPVLVLLFGSGMLPLSLIVALSSVWPILLNMLYGVRGTDPTAVQTARSFGLGSIAILARVKLPNALPFAFTGIRVSASIGLIVAVSAELLVGNGRGIGGYILVNSASATNLDTVYAATLVAGVLGVIVSALFSLLDRKAFGWKEGLAQ